MSEAQAGPSTAKGRSRKRRRRAKSYSVDSSSDDDSSEEEVSAPKPAPSHSESSSSEDSDDSDSDDSGHDDGPAKRSKSSNDSSDDSDDSDTSDDSDDSDSDDDKAPVAGKTAPAQTLPQRQTRYPTLSPSPPPHTLPPFLAKRTTEPTAEETERRQKFRDVYMSKLVEGFGGDLEKMRTADPNLNSDRLQRLIESLQSGMDVFSDPQQPNGKGKDGVDEVGVIIGQK